MGAYASNLSDNPGTLVSEVSHPGKNDWISAHATACGMSLLEVERLWMRFQQLGADENGILPPNILNKPPATENIFARNILANMRDGDEEVSFETFCNVTRWAETATLEDKVKGVFYLVNGGAPILKTILQRVLVRVYPDNTEAENEKMTDTFLTEIDVKKQGYIDEEEFVAWVMGQSQQTLLHIMEFHTIPPNLKAPSQRSTGQPQRTPSVKSLGSQVPSDSLLQEVANLAHWKDWHLLANQLNLVSADINILESKHPQDKQAQVYEMLTVWREREGQAATCSVLEKALRESNMNDIAMQVLVL